MCILGRRGICRGCPGAGGTICLSAQNSRVSLYMPATHRPDLGVVPVDDRVHAHKGGPVAVGRVEVGQGGAVGVGPAGADEDGPEAGPVAQVGVEGGAHGQGVAAQVEVVGVGGALDEGVDLGERVRRHDIDGLQGGREGPRRRAAHGGRRRGGVGRDLGGQAVGDGGGVGWGVRREGRREVGWRLEVPREAGEDQDEQDEAVLAAVVGEGELLDAVGVVVVVVSWPGS